RRGRDLGSRRALSMSPRVLLCAVTFALCGCWSSVDLSLALSYPCHSDAGAEGCPADMRCGLEQRCHRIGFPAPYLCQSSPDCELNWRCGLEGVCHSPDVAAAYQCRASADCELGWICRLDGR